METIHPDFVQAAREVFEVFEVLGRRIIAIRIIEGLQAEVQKTEQQPQQELRMQSYEAEVVLLNQNKAAEEAESKRLRPQEEPKAEPDPLQNRVAKKPAVSQPVAWAWYYRLLGVLGLILILVGLLLICYYSLQKKG